jgi:hypothetical protein
LGEDKDYMDDEESNDTSNFQKAFGWFLVVNRIVGNDFTKHEFVYEKKIMEVLNQLSFLISYDQEQIRLQRKAQGQIL